jgi:hypothetical protein
MNGNDASLQMEIHKLKDKIAGTEYQLELIGKKVQVLNNDLAKVLIALNDIMNSLEGDNK